MKIFAKITFGILFFFGLIVAATVFAVSPTTTIQVPINVGLPVPSNVAIPVSGPDGRGPAAIVANFYTLSFLVAGFLAFVKVVFGGVRWTFSGGNKSMIHEGQEDIKNAFYGLALLFFAFLIPWTINPDLTVLKVPVLEPYKPPPTTDLLPGDDSNCGLSVAQLQITDPDALAFENGANVSFASANPQVNQNLQYLNQQVNAAKVALRRAGASATVNSAYRPLSYQRHLFNVFGLHNTFIKFPDLAVKCAGLKAEVDREMAKHQITGAVALPGCTAPHVIGKAVDLEITGMSEAAASALFASSNIDLYWRNITNDPIHFEVSRPPNPTITAC